MPEKEKPCGEQPQGLGSSAQSARPLTPSEKGHQMSNMQIPASQEECKTCVQTVDDDALRAALEQEIADLQQHIDVIRADTAAAMDKIRLIRKIGNSRLPVEKKVELTQRVLSGGAL